MSGAGPQALRRRTGSCSGGYYNDGKMLDAILKKIFGTKHERDVKRMQPAVAAIGALEPAMQALSDDALRATWRDRRAEEDRRWIFLQAEVVTSRSEPAGLGPGLHLVTRWGDLLRSWPPGPWDIEAVERELLGWEDRDGCDLCAAP